MPTNTYFEENAIASEQGLLDSLIQEAIQIHGKNVYYVARDMNNFDKILGADDSSSYTRSWEIEMYPKNTHGYGGARDFLMQMGAVLEEKIQFTCSITVFNTIIGTPAGFARPREGDLIFFPPSGKAFKITFVEPREQFYQLGSLYTYEINTELFEYSGELFNTGIPQLDALTELSINIVDWALLDEQGNILTTEDGDILTVDGYDFDTIDPDAENTPLLQQSNTFIDWTDKDPFSEGVL